MFDLQMFAALRINEESKLTLKVATGTSSRGATIYSNRSVSNISPVATDTNVLNFATAYAALQVHTLGSVVRTSTAELVEDD